MASGQRKFLPSVPTALQTEQPSQLARIAASSPQQPDAAHFSRRFKLKYFGGQVFAYPLRGLQLRAGSRRLKYCLATAPYSYFYFFRICLFALLVFVKINSG
jgi:hypothetical protein